MISDFNSNRCKIPVPNTLACREELFPTAVAERLLVNVWRWGLKLLPKVKIHWQHIQSLTQTLAKIPCLTYPCDTPSLTAILCHVTITWWEAIIITVCSKSCWSFSYNYVIGFEKRAHFAQIINFRYGLKLLLISCYTNLKLQTCVSHEQKQLQTPNKVQLEAYWLLFILCDNPKIKVLLQVGPFLKSYHIYLRWVFSRYVPIKRVIAYM